MNFNKYFLISSLCLLLTACFEPPQNLLRIGTNRWLGYEPLYLARDLGYFKPESGRLVEYPSATEVMAAFRNHLLDGAALTMDEVISLLTTAPDTRVVLVFDISNGGDAIIAQPHIKTLKQLEGLRIGVESTAVGGFLLQKALNSVGLSTKDVILTSLTMDKHEASFVSQKIDAIVTFEPTRSRLVAQGGIDLFNSGQLSEKIIDVLVVRDGVLKTNEKEWKALVQAWFKALNYVKENKQKAMENMSIRMGSSPELISQMLEGIILPDIEQNHYFLNSQTPKLRQQAENLLDWMSIHGFLSQNISSDAISSLPTPLILPSINP